jgi:hypothetical protein
LVILYIHVRSGWPTEGYIRGYIVFSNVRLLETAESLAETSSIEFEQCCIFTICY